MKLFILGDSYSTFENYIPDDYRTYYSEAGREGMDLNRVHQTWWYQLVEEVQAELVLNSSYSGTTICNTGYDGEDCTYKSFIGRVDKLIENNFFAENEVDTCIIFGGTNDSWANSPVGKLQYSNWTKEDLDSTLPAFCYLLSRMKEHLPNARIIVVINCDIKESIAQGCNTASEHFSVEVVELQNIDKAMGHPTIAGMKQIKEQICSFLGED